MNLARWIESFPVREVIGRHDCEVQRIVADSRTVAPGDLFVALRGVKEDGQKFIAQAARRGAVAVLSESRPAESHPDTGEAFKEMTWVCVADARGAMSDLAAYFLGHPARRLHLVGVTGTNGKTTTCHLINALFQAAGVQGGLIGTLGVHFGGGTYSTGHTTPGALELQQFFAKMCDAGVTHVVMEVSSHALDQKRVSGVEFDVAVFTNLTQDHLDYHQDMRSYYAAKCQLFDQVSSAGYGVVNIDDPWGVRLTREKNLKWVTYGLAPGATCFLKSMVSDMTGLRMTVETPVGGFNILSPLLGKYNAYNILAAISVGVALGLSQEAMMAGIASLNGVPGRFEPVVAGQAFGVIVDYAHTEDALCRLLTAVSELTSGKVITVFGCGGDRDRGKRPKMGAVAARLSDHTILTSDNPRSESALAIIHEIKFGLREADPEARCEVLPNRKEAIERAIFMAQETDTVVIAGKGHEADQIIGERRLPFDDRDVARAALMKRMMQGPPPRRGRTPRRGTG